MAGLDAFGAPAGPAKTGLPSASQQRGMAIAPDAQQLMEEARSRLSFKAMRQQARQDRQEAASDAAARRSAARRAAAAAAAKQQATLAAAPAASSPPPAQVAPPSPAGTPQHIALAMLGSFGWPASQFGCLVSLWNAESSWNPEASNPSGAYGIPQALPGSKMASAGPDWQTDAATQIRWGLGYIKAMYGSPCGAWSHEEETGWY